MNISENVWVFNGGGNLKLKIVCYIVRAVVDNFFKDHAKYFSTSSFGELFDNHTASISSDRANISSNELLLKNLPTAASSFSSFYSSSSSPFLITTNPIGISPLSSSLAPKWNYQNYVLELLF